MKQQLASRFNGVTAYLQSPAEGVWKQAGEAAHDEIVIFEVMVEEIDLPFWRDRREELEQRFRQEKVVIRHMPIELI